MSAPVRKLTLTAHVTFSVGWIGTVIAYLALGVAAVASFDDKMVRADWIAMTFIGWFVIAPLAVASLLSGLVMAVGSRWGLFRHYWVVISLALTIVSTGVLLLHMPSVSANAEVAQRSSGAALEAIGGDLIHPGIGLVVLLVVQVLNVYKPKGLTRHGLRVQETVRAERAREKAVAS